MKDGPSESAAKRVEQERDFYLRLLNLGAQDRLEPLLEEALAVVVEIVGAERGYLEIRDDESDESWSIARRCTASETEEIQRHISRGIIAEALATGSTVLTHSARLDERFRERDSIQGARIEAVLCAPVGGNAALGVVYLQGRRHPGSFSEDDQRHAERLAHQLAPFVDRLLLRRKVEDRGDATRELRARYALDGIVGRSPALARTLKEAMLAAPLDVNVLLTGESGTGKSQLARAIHANSGRREGPFVELNCAALPAPLLESELFGALKGSHSEAHRDLPGKVAAAGGGTLFLDEVGDLAYESQAKLLHLLQSREYYPLGATRPRRADIRLIAATNVDLASAVAERRFRQDLLYRLQVLPLRLPSLAERRDDVELLATFLAERIAERHSLRVSRLSPSTLRALRDADWPGNIRQLENALEAATVRASGAFAEEIAVRHVFPGQLESDARDDAPLGFQDATRQFQRSLLLEHLEATGWNVTETARRLDLARSHVYNLIASLRVERPAKSQRS